MNPQASQIEILLKQHITANSVCVRLLDLDDRTKDFETVEKAFDISYVVFGGYMLKNI